MPTASIPRIALDARHIANPHEGIAKHMRRVVEILAHADDFQYYLTGTAADLSGLSTVFDSTILEKLGTIETQDIYYSSKGQAHFARQLKSNRIDLFHSHYPFLPLAADCRKVLTVHDVIPLKFPQYYPELEQVRRLLPLYAKRADHIMADSLSTSRDLEQMLHVSAEKVSIVRLGVEKQFKPIPDKRVIRDFLQRTHLPEHFVLWTGTTRLTKNAGRLVEAFGLLKQKAQLPHKLVMTLGTPLQDRKIIRNIIEYHLIEDVIFIDTVTEQDLPILYNAASAFIFPSLYEGFGLPPLEAMSCGTPVICSRAASLPEVVGDGAILVGPYDTTEMAAALWAILAEPELREETIERGLRQAAQFTWENTATATAGVYAKILSS